jgi:hypothetical protein
MACGECHLERGVKVSMHSTAARTAKAAAVVAYSKALKVSKAKGSALAVPSED